MSWLGLWSGSTTGRDDLAFDFDEELAKLQYCTEEQSTLVAQVIEGMKNAISRGFPLFSSEDEDQEQAKLLLRRCVWACHHFKEDHNIVRSALEIILSAIRPARTRGESVPSGVTYLHLLYCEVLFEHFESGKSGPDLSNMRILLNLLAIPEFQIRYHLTSILQFVMKNNKTSQLQSEILGDPMAVATIVELLGDKETIRLQALGILVGLTESPQEELQKIIAFSGGFERAFAVMESVGGYWSDDTVGTLNALRLIKNLVRKNLLNQNYFRETSCIPRLVPLLEVDQSDTWLLTDTKAGVVVAALEILYYLCSGGSVSSAAINQSEVEKHKMLPLVITWALDRINSPLIRSRALFALGSLLRHHTNNRNQFSQQTIRIARESTPQPTLHRVLTLTFHSQSFAEQVSAVYAFVNYLHENTESQLAIVTTLTPPPDSAQSSSMADAHAGANSIGRQLIKSLQEGYKQPVASYMASVLLASVLADNEDCKQVALRIQLSLDRPGENLLALCMKLLRSNQAQKQTDDSLEAQIASIGFLRLLCVWMFQFPPLVAAFLSVPENLPFLVELILQQHGNVHLQGMCALLVGFCFMFNENEDPDDMSNNRLALHGIICHRIGLDKFLGTLDAARKSTPFQEAEHLDISSQDLTQVNYDVLLYDADLIEFIKNARDQLLRDLRSPNKRKADHIMKDQMKEKEQEINQLKEKIKELEDLLHQERQGDQVLQQTALSTSEELQQALERIQELEADIDAKEDALQSLSMAYNDLESHLAQTQSAPPTRGDDQHTHQDDQHLLMIGSLEEENKKLKESLQALQTAQVQSADAPSGDDQQSQRIQSLEEELNKLRQQNQEQQQKEQQLASQLHQTEENHRQALHQVQAATNSADQANQENKLLQQQVEEKEEALQRVTNQLQQQQNKTSVPSTSGANAELDACRGELKEWKLKFQMLEKEQEDLLIMLAREEIQVATLEERIHLLEQG